MALRPTSLPIKVGSVATKDIIATENDSYVSQVLTDKAKTDAMNAVAPIYLPADPAINRLQTEKLQAITSFITTTRDDKLASAEQKITDLQNISEITLSKDQARALLSLTNDQWNNLKSEALGVFDQIMRRTIREYQVTDTINAIPGLIKYSFSPEHTQIIIDLISPLVSANSIFSETETSSAREIAASLVEPVIKSFSRNQAIVLRGQIINPEQYEALEHYNLIRPNQKTKELIATASLVLLLTGFTILYFSRRKLTPLNDLRHVTVIAIILLLFLYTARVLIPNRTIVPYFFPLPAFALILAALFNLEISIFFSLILSILISFGVSASPDLVIFSIITSVIGALTLKKGRKAINFLWAGSAIAVSGILVLAAYRLTSSNTDLIGLLTLFGATFLNGFASASLALLLQYMLSQLLRLPTPMHLIEISRSDHPLLKHILQFAPGTYQHSLQVSNLAEQAAEVIGADALLTRVGALFHDAGKSSNPSFFIENQVPGALNTHDGMDPVIAAQTIIQHVTDGVKLAEKHHLPPRLQDFMREHHGTQVTRYQYNRALEQQNNQVEKVDIELFRYPGPKPQTKETGILMLADGCEARVRAELPKNEEDLRNIVRKVFDFITSQDLLENTNLTLRDLKTIQESFVTTLSNSYHPRIQYPESNVTTSEKNHTFQVIEEK